MMPRHLYWRQISKVFAITILSAMFAQAAQANRPEMETTVLRALIQLDLAHLNLQTAALAFRGLLSFEVSGDQCNPQVFLSSADPDQITGSIVGTVVTPGCEQPVALSTVSVGLDFKQAGTFDMLRAQLAQAWGQACDDQFAAAAGLQTSRRGTVWKRPGAIVMIAEDGAAPTALALTLLVTNLHPKTETAAAQYQRDLQMFQSALPSTCK